MLHSMQQPVPAQSNADASSFAGLLASLTAPAREEEERTPEWRDDELGEDVATLSYERALRTHARYKPDNRWDGPASATARPEAYNRNGATCAAVPPAKTPLRQAGAATSRNLRSASVTIRLSKEECKQLHERAAEAGLTVSAYLRSCTFEVETLRSQVKDTLAEMRAAEADRTSAAMDKEQKNWFMRMKRMFPGRNLSAQDAERG